MFDKKKFGAHLRELRKEKKVPQETLAVLLGVSKTQISDLEKGETTTTMERLILLADYFEVSLDELFCREWPPTE